MTGTLTTDDPYVTIANGDFGLGRYRRGGIRTNATAFTFTVAAGAGYNHPIDFTLDVSDTSGDTGSFELAMHDRIGIEDVSGTIPSDITWTNDKTYRRS